MIQTVDARELWLFLDSSRQFADWIKDRIVQYGFREGTDFTIHKTVKGRAASTDYALSLDMAKELSMVERNARGKQARQYFIEMEKQAKEAAAKPKALSLDDPMFLRQALTPDDFVPRIRGVIG